MCKPPQPPPAPPPPPLRACPLGESRHTAAASSESCGQSFTYITAKASHMVAVFTSLWGQFHLQRLKLHLRAQVGFTVAQASAPAGHVLFIRILTLFTLTEASL